MKRAGVASAVLAWPGDADKSGISQPPLPAAQILHLVGEVVELRRKPDPVFPVEVGFQPLTALLAKASLFNSRRQIHNVGLSEDAKWTRAAYTPAT